MYLLKNELNSAASCARPTIEWGKDGSIVGVVAMRSMLSRMNLEWLLRPCG
jgi:hypothetical protein